MKIINIIILLSICTGQDSLKAPDLNTLMNAIKDSSGGLLRLSEPMDVQDLFPNEKSDPFIKPLFPHEIEAIKKKANDFEPEPNSESDIVILETSMGTMKLRLFPDIAPEHCRNFKKLSNSGFYDGTTFHRIIPDFMIQGGDILSRDSDKGNDGTGSPGWTVKAEFNSIKHKRGILSMARSRDPNSAGSQFFICVSDAFHLNGAYTAFGEVIENIEVIDKIVNSPTDYSQVKIACKTKIPDGSDPKKWVTLTDPKTKKRLYAHIPPNETASSFRHKMKKELMSDNPVFPIRMKKVRVVDATTNNEQ